VILDSFRDISHDPFMSPDKRFWVKSKFWKFMSVGVLLWIALVPWSTTRPLNAHAWGIKEIIYLLFAVIPAQLWFVLKPMLGLSQHALILGGSFLSWMILCVILARRYSAR
jgi:hypothetical protein